MEDSEWSKETGMGQVLGLSFSEPNDTDNKILNIPNTHNKHMKLMELFDNINIEEKGKVQLFLASLLNQVVLNRDDFRELYRFFPDPQTRFIEYMADTIVHEWGHAIGMPHPFSDQGANRRLFASKWKNDPMSYDEHR